MNVLSLFDGMSCGRIALERAGVKVDTYYASEIDKYAMQVSKANWSDIVQIGDVTKVHAFMLKEIDLLIGGSPCQGFSFAGKQLNFEDPRSKLFFEFVRLLEEIREYNPDVLFFLENVVMKKEYQDVISKLLGVEPICINSSLVSAQNRKRLYWTNIHYLGFPKSKNISFNNIVDKDISSYRYLTNKTIVRAKENKRSRVIYNYNSLVPCILHNQRKQSTDSISVVTPDGSYRWLSPLEAERCQTVPEGYTKVVSFGNRNGMLGNGWTVDVIKHFFLPLGDYSFMF